MGKIIIRAFIWLFICILTCSCVSRRVITNKTKENVSEAKYTQLFEKLLVNNFTQGRTLLHLDSLNIDQKIHFVVYDTERLDSLGNCPVKVEGDITTSVNNSSQTIENDSLRNEIKEDITVNNKIQRNDSLIHREEKEKKVSSSPASDFISFAIVGVVILLVIVSINFYKR